MVIAILAVLVALCLPAVTRSRYGARLAQCKNNLKQISLALRSYESEYHCLPPAYTVGENGKPLHSWRTLILPYLEQGDLYKKIDLTKPWNDPVNAEAARAIVPAFKCPSADCPAEHTSYVAVVAANGSFRSAEPRTLAEITNNHGETLLVLEVDAKHAVPWMAPSDADLAIFKALGSSTTLPHVGGTYAAFVDAHVRKIDTEISPEGNQRLVSISGKD